ncbi:MAG TPA: excisionase family DNA-binding protein [Beijerinckiaceae bacterium]|jgi:excisionase family DNA binding protein
MPGLSLREAAQQTGTSKSTILRAIQSGRLSAARTDDGGYAIDPAELFRVYQPRPQPDPEQDSKAGHGASAATEAATELRIRNAQLEAGFNALKAILEAEKKHMEELREDRDRWAAQAERLALPAPQPPQASQAKRGGLFGWRKGQG